MLDAEPWKFDITHYIDMLAERWTEAAKLRQDHDSTVYLIRFKNLSE
jgi:hypothetical protein